MAAKFTGSLDKKYSEKICAAFFRAISPAEFRVAERYFLRPRRGGLPDVKGQALVVVISLLLYPSPHPSLSFSSFSSPKTAISRGGKECD